MSAIAQAGTQRLLVTRRDPHTRAYEAIGEVRRGEEGFTFEYRSDATHTLPGMRDTSRTYTSSRLFPLFEHRVISPRRGDYDEYLANLALDEVADPFEVLARSGGRSAVDTLELTPLPEPGPVDLTFLVHGIRHLEQGEQERVDALAPGEELDLTPEPENKFDGRAVLVTRDACRLGYVPGPLLPSIHRIMRSDLRVAVERVNAHEAGFHMRLLVRLTGTY